MLGNNSRVFGNDLSVNTRHVLEHGWKHTVFNCPSVCGAVRVAITGRHCIARGNLWCQVPFAAPRPTYARRTASAYYVVLDQRIGIFAVNSAVGKSGKSAKTRVQNSRRGGTTSARQAPMSGTTCASALSLQFHWGTLAPDLFVNISV
jgi:hypothetical protein